MLGKISSKLSVEPTNENLTQQNVQFRATKPIPNDSVEISTKKKEKKHWVGTLAAIGTVIAVGALVFGGRSKALKEIDIDEFKKLGNKFGKGKALTSKGKPYTGTIVYTSKNGDKKLVQYVDGVWTQTSKVGKNPLGGQVTTLSKQVGVYAENGELTHIENFINGRTVIDGNFELVKIKTHDVGKVL